jgi:hypothetical protein
MARVLGVHGVGNLRAEMTPEQAAHNLAGIWHKHLCRGGVGLRPHDDVVVAYYAALLHPPGRQGAGAGGLDDLPADAEDMLWAWLTEHDLPTGTARGRGTWPLRQALAWIAERRHLAPHLVELFVATFFREVAAYLRTTEGGARHAAREQVAEAIHDHNPQVVLAHSLGSVVAYEALWAHAELHVDLLITVGSPLALPHAVFPRLVPAPENGLGARPPGVRRWINLADPGDLVALPPQGISRRFHGIDLDDQSVIHAFDFHLVANYLANQRLAQILHSHLDEK